MNHPKLTKQNKEFIIQTIVEKLEKKKVKIIMFGSVVAGSASSRSDVDLALDIGKPIDPAKIAFIKEAFEESHLPFDVDIIDLHRVSTEFRKIVLEKGCTIKL